MGGLIAIALLAAPLQIALAQQQPAPAGDGFDLLPPEKKPDPQEQQELEQKLEALKVIEKSIIERQQSQPVKTK